MSEQSLVWLESVEVIQKPKSPRFDFRNVRVAPQLHTNRNDFSSLEIGERRELIIKLIEKVKSI